MHKILHSMNRFQKVQMECTGLFIQFSTPDMFFISILFLFMFHFGKSVITNWASRNWRDCCQLRQNGTNGDPLSPMVNASNGGYGTPRHHWRSPLVIIGAI